jgi:hypothetical protein
MLRRLIFASLLIASPAIAQQWSPPGKGLVPGASASYSFSASTNSVGVPTSCNSIVATLDLDVVGAQTGAIASVMGCSTESPVGTSSLTSCAVVATITTETPTPIAWAWPIMKVRVDALSGGSATSRLTAGCSESVSMDGGPAGAGDAADLTTLDIESPSSWDDCPDGLPEFQAEANGCLRSQVDDLLTAIDDLVAVAELAGYPTTACTTPNGQDCITFQIQNSEAVGFAVATDGDEFGYVRMCQLINDGGVFACKVSSGTGFTTVERVIVAPPRTTTSDHPDFDVLSVVAWDYASGNTANETDIIGPTGGSGHNQKIPITVAPGLYELDREPLFEQNTASTSRSWGKFEGYGVQIIVNWNAPAGSSTVANLGTGSCPAVKGTVCEITDAVTIDDVSVGGAASANIDDVDSDSTACPDQWGVNGILVDASTNLAVRDQFTTVNSGTRLQLPDLVRLAGAGIGDYVDGRQGENDGIYPVTLAKDADEFCVKSLNAPPVAAVVGSGTVQRMTTVAWYDGEHWMPGRCVFCFGSPESDHPITDVELAGFTIHFDGELDGSRSIRQTAVRLNGNKIGNAGGINNFRVHDIALTGASLRGQVGVDVGGAVPDGTGEASNIDVWNISADPFPAAQSPFVWVRGAAAFVSVRQIYSIHGGACLWMGQPGLAWTTPHTISLSESRCAGAGDGPVLAAFNGNNLNVERTFFGSDVNGPLSGTPQSDSGFIGILGGVATSQMTVSISGCRVDIVDESDLPAYFHLGDLDQFTLSDCLLKKGPGASSGAGAGALFASVATSDWGEVVVRDSMERDTDGGATVPLFDIATTPPATVGWLCPGCQSTQSVGVYMLDAGGNGIVIDAGSGAMNCLVNVPNSAQQTCSATSNGAAPATAFERVAFPVGAGPSWLHDCAFVNGSATPGGASGDLITVQPMITDGGAESNVGATFNIAWDVRSNTIPLNRLLNAAAAATALKLKMTAQVDTGTNNNATLAGICRVSKLRAAS